MEVNSHHINGYGVKCPYYENGELYWYGGHLETLARRFGTPVHVGSTEAVYDAVHSFERPFIEAGLPLSIYFSVKTNPAPIFLDVLQKTACGYEIISAFEGEILKRLGISSGRIIQTGVFDEENDDNGSIKKVKMVTVSSLNQLKRLVETGEKWKQTIPLGISIRPALWRSYWDITLNTSRKSSPVGVSLSSPVFHQMLDLVKREKYLNLIGFHMHLGSGIRKAAPFLKGIQTLEQAAIEAAQMDLKIHVLDIGGGYGLSSAPMMKVRNIVSSLLGLSSKQNKNPESDYLLDSIAKQLNRTIMKLEKRGILINEIAAEPGRILSGSCQLMILTVKEVIESNKRNFLICDAGAMSLSPMLITEQHEIIPLSQRKGPLITYEVLGRLPSALDRVAVSARLPVMKAGDHIAVMDTGAYILSMNNTFSGPRPPIVWIENGNMELVRRRETMNDIFNLDLKPVRMRQTIKDNRWNKS